MDIGQLRHRLTFQPPTEARDTMGGVVTTWPEADWITVWAAIWSLRDKEAAESMKLQGKKIRRVIIRYRSGITDKYRIYWERKGIYLNIKSINDLDERGAFLEILAEKVV